MPGHRFQLPSLSQVDDRRKVPIVDGAHAPVNNRPTTIEPAFAEGFAPSEPGEHRAHSRGAMTWLAGVVDHLQRNRDRLVDGLSRIDGVDVRTPQAGYLAWVDCSGARSGVDVATLLQQQAQLYTSPGPDYGGAPDWVRLNFATSATLVEDMTRRMARALR